MEARLMFSNHATFTSPTHLVSTATRRPNTLSKTTRPGISATRIANFNISATQLTAATATRCSTLSNEVFQSTSETSTSRHR